MIMRFFVWVVLVSTVLFSASVEQMKQEKRYAFIVANGLKSETDSDSAVVSAKKLQSYMESKGFQTVTVYNQTRADLIKSFRSFDRNIQPHSVIAVVYSGRTVTYDGQTWLLPAAMDLESLNQLRLSAVSLNFLLDKFRRHSPRVVMGIMDVHRYSGHPNDTDGATILASLKTMKETDLLLHFDAANTASSFFPSMVVAIGNKVESLATIAGKLGRNGALSRVSDEAFYFNVPNKLLSDVDKAWNRAVEKNSVVGYEAFLIAFPESNYKQTAINRIDGMNAKRTSAVAAVQNKNAALQAAEAKLRAQREELERLRAQANRTAATAGAKPVERSEIFIEPEEMVTIPAGVYLMGSEAFESAQPVHLVEVKKPFKMSAFEVSNKEYAAFIKATGTKYRKKKLLKNESAAAVYVSWEDAARYADWLSKMTGKHYRLPTESEWEYAARAGSDALFSWGDGASLAPQYAWMADNAHGFVHSRGLLQPNAFGLFDMAGNAAEWCIDAATPDYKGAPSVSNRAVKDDDGMKIIRGGSYKSGAEAVSPSYRDSNIPTYKDDGIGFRLVEVE